MLKYILILILLSIPLLLYTDAPRFCFLEPALTLTAVPPSALVELHFLMPVCSIEKENPGAMRRRKTCKVDSVFA